MLSFRPRMTYDSRAPGKAGTYYITQQTGYDPYIVTYVPNGEIEGKFLGPYMEVIYARQACEEYEKDVN